MKKKKMENIQTIKDCDGNIVKLSEKTRRVPVYSEQNDRLVLSCLTVDQNVVKIEGYKEEFPLVSFSNYIYLFSSSNNFEY